jgi:hypothetical protein
MVTIWPGCGGAPVLQVNDRYHESVDASSTRELIAELRQNAQAMKHPGPRQAPTYWITIDRDASPLGLQDRTPPGV